LKAEEFRQPIGQVLEDLFGHLRQSTNLTRARSNFQTDLGQNPCNLHP
jgi:hypothetical protein